MGIGSLARPDASKEQRMPEAYHGNARRMEEVSKGVASNSLAFAYRGHAHEFREVDRAVFAPFRSWQPLWSESPV